MKCHSKTYVTTLLGLALLLFIGALSSTAEEQQAKASAQAQEQEAETDYTEEEYNAYEAATKEADVMKRGEMLLAYLEKYSKPTTLTPYVTRAYSDMLRDLANAKKFDQLEPLAEKWLKLHPGDKDTLVLVAMATASTGNLERCVECLEEIYVKEPSPELAHDIFDKYGAIKNLAKQIEWAEKLFKMPKFDAEYGLRWDFVKRYMDSENYPKAAEYARLTLKSADLVKQPDKATEENLRTIRRWSNHVIGMHLMEQDKWQEAIDAFSKALKAERYDLGYFYIAMCFENQKKVEEAMVEYAKAELQRGEVESKAKERLELLYKALHNDTTIGIDKKYRQAKEELAAEQPRTAVLK